MAADGDAAGAAPFVARRVTAGATAGDPAGNPIAKLAGATAGGPSGPFPVPPTPPMPAMEPVPAGADAAPPAHRAPPPIPDAIEGTAQPASRSDPLAPLTVDATLHTLEPVTAPLELRAVLVDAGPARARLAQRTDGATPDPLRDRQRSGAWYEVGEAPLPGWTVVGIAAESVTLMTPYGNLVRLRVAPASR